jgi:hypothetical protein
MEIFVLIIKFLLLIVIVYTFYVLLEQMWYFYNVDGKLKQFFEKLY